MEKALHTILEKEPALPGMKLLFDPDRLRVMLRRQLPQVEWSAVRPVYVRYKPGMNCLVGFEALADGMVQLGYAKALQPDQQAKLNKVRHGEQETDTPLSGVEPKEGVFVSLFPNDLKLPAIKRLSDARQKSALMHRLWEEDRRREGKLNVVRYKPERRLVTRLEVEGIPLAALKFYTGRGYQTAYANARLFSSRGPLRVARRVCRSNRHRILGFEWLPGRLLGAALRRGYGTGEEAERVGEALACLHQTPIPSPVQVLNPVCGLEAAAESLKWILPELWPLAQRLAKALVHALDAAGEAQVLLHGDFYAKQVIIQKDHIGFIDFDGSGVGHAAVDVGNFIAHLERDLLRGYIDATLAEALRNGLLSGYNRSAKHPVSSRQADLYTAAGLLKLVPHPFRFLEENWPEQVRALLQRTERLLDNEQGGVHPVLHAGQVQALLEDQAFANVKPALDPAVVTREMADRMGGGASLQHIRLKRHKPGRRCMLAYTWQFSDGKPPAVVLGKVRAKGLDHRTYALMKQLWQTGWGPEASPGRVPEPMGAIADWHMWLQREVQGKTVGALLQTPETPAVMTHVAQSLRRLHHEGPRPGRMHTIEQELGILTDRLDRVRYIKPAATLRFARVLEWSRRASSCLINRPVLPIHRDFYHDNVLWNGSQVYLLDFDLYSLGDPALDAGNFIGHLIELGIREHNSALAYEPLIHAFREAFLSGQPDATRQAVEVYTTLTLARHIYISTAIPGRGAATETLLRCCEERLSTYQRAIVL